MTSAYTAQLELRPRLTSVNIQKFDGSALETYGMASAIFSLQNGLGRV